MGWGRAGRGPGRTAEPHFHMEILPPRASEGAGANTVLLSGKGPGGGGSAGA